MKKQFKLYQGDNIESLKKLPDNSIDSVVTDPPYGLGKEQDMNIILNDWLEKGYSEIKGSGFMGKTWDSYVPQPAFWKEIYRVLKPGGHILAFFGTRTYDIGTMAIRLAGFEIRDQVMWLYGSGFPKSHNIGKAVDKIEGNQREVVGSKGSYRDIRSGSLDVQLTEDRDRIEVLETKGQSKYEGWGTALKPANEPICVARKPLSEKTIAENVIKWGTGGINIDGCRVGSEIIKSPQQDTSGGIFRNISKSTGQIIENEGRFPANLILDETAAELLDQQSGMLKSGFGEIGSGDSINDGSKVGMKGKIVSCYADKGGASRYFFNVKQTDEEHQTNSRFLYVAKVSKKERNLGLDGFEEKESVLPGLNTFDEEGNRLRSDGSIIPPLVSKNSHPTVKPINLMTYLCRLVTPPNGIVLDPFMGSGSTGIAAQLEGFRFVGMEMDEDYFKIAEARINAYEEYRKLLK